MTYEQESQLTPVGDEESISHLRQAISLGKHWYLALLEAIALWTSPEETRNDNVYRYLIDGEAFDWLLLAERLLETIDSLLPEPEKLALLFYARPPLPLTKNEFKELIGHLKYHQYLNYLYGITVEEALILAVQEEIRKEKRISGYRKEHDSENEAYLRIYDAGKMTLLRDFRQERDYPQAECSSLAELKEFTYWLFKRRLKFCDKARVASDTKKALEYLRRQQTKKRFPRATVNEELFIEPDGS